MKTCKILKENIEPLCYKHLIAVEKSAKEETPSDSELSKAQFIDSLSGRRPEGTFS